MPVKCTSDRLTDLALASRSEIRIICTLLPPELRQSPVKLPKIDRILSADNELQPVVAKTREIRALGGLVGGFFPPDLARQVRVANYREGELVLIAASSAAAAKTRLLAPSLSRYLAEQHWQVNSVSVRVQPTASQGKNGEKGGVKTVQLSSQSLVILRNLYTSMSSSPAREALAALLEHHQAAPLGQAPKSPAGAPRTSAAESGRRRKARP
jgi:hypothetical protein